MLRLYNKQNIERAKVFKMHPADWIDLSIHVPVSQLETAAAAAQMVSNSGLYIEIGRASCRERV